MAQGDLGRVLIGAGIALVVAGLLLIAAGKVPFGRLPGDIVIRRGSFTFYFPVVTSVVLSLVLTLLLSLLRR